MRDRQLVEVCQVHHVALVVCRVFLPLVEHVARLSNSAWHANFLLQLFLIDNVLLHLLQTLRALIFVEVQQCIRVDCVAAAHVERGVRRRQESVIAQRYAVGHFRVVSFHKLGFTRVISR